METFAVSAQSRVRLLRLRQTGKNAYGTHELCLSAFEIFGEVEGTASPGILASMKTKASQNIHDEGLVEITASSIDHRSSRPPKIIADYDHNDTFTTNNSANSWIRVNFMNRSIKPMSYVLRVGDWNRPKNWVLEGSNDRISWIELDRRENTDLPNFAVRRFPVAKSEEVRMIRLRQTGKNANGSDYLTIGSFDVSGTLLEASQ
jgi:hypothetical protein